MPRSLATAALLLTVAAAPATGQAAPCSWDQCALRLQYRAFDVRVVQGAAATPLGKVGLFAPRIEPLASGPDTVRYHYRMYRGDQVKGSIATLLGSAIMIGGFILQLGNAFDDQDAEWAYTAMFGAGAVITFVGTLTVRRSQDHLERAIWLYNRSLAGSGGP